VLFRRELSGVESLRSNLFQKQRVDIALDIASGAAPLAVLLLAAQFTREPTEGI
jgi:hypothetical protein